MKGTIKEHQKLMLKRQLDHIEVLSEIISNLDDDIKKTSSNKKQINYLDVIPGNGVRSAERIIAETGVKMEQVKNADHFCSWAGLIPECKESAGKKMSTRIRKGNKYLKATIVECARAAIRNKDCYFSARYKRISARRGSKRALIAIPHSMLIAIYHILKNNQPFKDLTYDYYTTLNKEKMIKKNLKSLESLGVTVNITGS